MMWKQNFQKTELPKEFTDMNTTNTIKDQFEI
jgi:hypothetical protein